MTRRTRRAAATLVATGAATLLAPTLAGAASLAVTGGDGNPIPLNPAAPPTTTNIDPDVTIAFPPGDGRFSLNITDAAGIAASSGLNCYGNSNFNRSVDFRGNGVYTVTVVNYGERDYSCGAPLSSETYQFTIAGGVTLTPPPATVLIRDPNSAIIKDFALGVALVPGALTYELRYAAGGVIAPDGSISGPSEQGFVNTTTGQAPLRFPKAGTYTVVARAKGYASGGDFFTPWSAPVKVRAVAPFDLGTLTFPDARGPSYSIRGVLRETGTRGRVSVAYARGTKGGKYKSAGSAKISSKGTFTKRLRLTRTGKYRLRFKFKGSSTTLGGTVVQQVQVTRRTFFTG